MSNSVYAIPVRFGTESDTAEEVAEFSRSSREAAEAEEGTTTRFAVRFDEARFDVFDTFPDEEGRQAHLEGSTAITIGYRHSACVRRIRSSGRYRRCRSFLD